MLPTHIQQPWEREAAYRKGYERGLAASEPSRMITVDVSSSFPRSDTLGIPPRISFSRRQDTPMHDVLAEIHRRLPKIEHPFTLTTLGAHPRELALETNGEVMEFLQPWDASILRLRLNVESLKPDKAPKKTLGARLGKALGLSKDHSGESSIARTAVQSKAAGRSPPPSSMRSAPPSYGETMRSVA